MIVGYGIKGVDKKKIVISAMNFRRERWEKRNRRWTLIKGEIIRNEEKIKETKEVT